VAFFFASFYTVTLQVERSLAARSLRGESRRARRLVAGHSDVQIDVQTDVQIDVQTDVQRGGAAPDSIDYREVPQLRPGIL